jgi:hypothetical protein
LARAAIANVPFVEAFYLKKASRKGRMLTLGGKLLDFAVKAVIHRKECAGVALPLQYATAMSQRWARTNPACWAASSLLNQTSATVRL